jgi:hypothetical protein
VVERTLLNQRFSGGTRRGNTPPREVFPLDDSNDQNYYDQMHLVHDCRAFTGESPSRFLAHLEGVPAFHTFFATQPARDTSDRLAGVASLLSGDGRIHYHP